VVICLELSSAKIYVCSEALFQKKKALLMK